MEIIKCKLCDHQMLYNYVKYIWECSNCDGDQPDEHETHLGAC